MGTIPVSVGQSIKTHIHSINAQGQGVAKIDGYVVFVDNALPGEECTIRISKVLSKYAQAKLIKRDNASKIRTQPECEYYDRCGGCQLQHINYKAQLLLKQKSIIDAFKKNQIDIKDIIKPTIGMKNPWHYRNKAIFNVAKDGNKGIIGMYKANSHKMVEINRCYLVNESLNVLLKVTRAHLKYLYAKDEFFQLPFNKVFGRAGINKQVMAGFISKGDVPQYVDSLVVNLRRANRDIVSIFHNKTLSDGGNLSRDNTFLWGMKTIKGEIGEMEFEVSPNSFFQINTVQTAKLFEVIKDFCALTGSETVFDLYCGVGTIGMYVAKGAKRVIGIESVLDSIESAQSNAKRNNVRNIEFLTGESEKILPSLLNMNISPDVIIIDPPRKGCSKAFMKILSKSITKKIVYVSCNPATLARDTKSLIACGYKVESIQPVDMFPHTHHVECVVKLIK